MSFKNEDQKQSSFKVITNIFNRVNNNKNSVTQTSMTPEQIKTIMGLANSDHHLTKTETLLSDSLISAIASLYVFFKNPNEKTNIDQLKANFNTIITAIEKNNTNNSSKQISEDTPILKEIKEAQSLISNKNKPSKALKQLSNIKLSLEKKLITLSPSISTTLSKLLNNNKSKL